MTILLIACVINPISNSAQTTDDTTAFMQGLRDRQLHRIAIAYAEDRLKQVNLTPTQRVTLTLELMQTHADWARQLSGEDRLAEYETAHQVAATFKLSHADLARAILVDVQDALIDLSAGRALRMEREVGRADEATRQLALNHLRTAIRKLEALDEVIGAAIPNAFRSEADSESLRGEQLMALRQRVRFQRGIALQNQAMLFADDDRLNRIDALSEVLREMNELSNTVPQENTLWWMAQIERAESLRLLERYEDCDRLLKSLPEKPPQPNLATAVQVQRTRLQLAQGDASSALRDALAWRQKQTNVDPELDLAILTAMLTLAGESKDSPDQQQQWQEQAVAMSREIQSRHGPFWGRRANLELVGNTNDQPQISNVEILLQLGDENYLKGRFDEALQAYERAADEAANLNRPSRRFDAARKAGLLQQQLRRYADAARTLSDIAMETPNHELSPGTYLQAAWNLGQAAREDAALVTNYAEMLEQCIQQWPLTDAADQARLWLGKIYEYQKKFTAAVDVYLDVNRSSPRFTDAVKLAQAASSLALSASADDDQQTQIANTLASAFAERLPIEDQADWSEADIQVALEAARLLLLHGENRQRRASEILRRLLASKVAEDQPQLRSEIAALQLVESLQNATNDPSSKEQLNQLAEAPTDRLLDVADTLARLQESQSSEPSGKSTRIASTLLTITQQLLGADPPLSEVEQNQVRQYRAAARFAIGEIAEAIAEYRELFRANPRNGEILEAFAGALANSDNTQDWEEGLTRSRQLAQGSLPQSDRWFRAKYQTALMLDKLGRKEEAVRLLRFTKETPPGWQEAPNRDAFEALLKRLQ